MRSAAHHRPTQGAPAHAAWRVPSVDGEQDLSAAIARHPGADTRDPGIDTRVEMPAPQSSVPRPRCDHIQRLDERYPMSYTPDVVAVVRRNLHRLKNCYEDRLSERPELASRVNLQITVLETGRVGEVEAIGNTTISTARSGSIDVHDPRTLVV